MVVFVIIFLLYQCIRLVHCNFECIGICYSGRMSPEDIFHGQHLKGFSYKNITTDDPRKCYSSCTQDCRCKACQMKDSRCELLDEDKTSKADNFTAETGYVYYDLKQTMFQGKSHMISSGNCYNGCCQSNLCKNGGTCIEKCHTPKEKFICQCPASFTGKYCERLMPTSCKDVLSTSSDPTSGVYKIFRTDSGNIINVYCAFQPKVVWTLIESFSLENNAILKNLPFSSIASENNNQPSSWDRYRMRNSRLSYFHSKSTVFAATCDYPRRMNSSIRPDSVDSLQGRLKDVDIIKETAIDGCTMYTSINIRNKQCFLCTAYTVSGGIGPYHIYIDNDKSESALCDFKPFEGGAHEYFGYYQRPNPESLCTATQHSTTQWWLGQEL